MNRNIKRLLASAMSCVILVTGLAFTKPEEVRAASQQNYTLAEGEKLQVQLDGTGAEESVLYEWSNKDLYYYLDLYINGEKVASFKNSEPGTCLGDVYITDIDTTDSVKDIFVLTYGSGSCGEITTLYYCRYENGKFKRVQNLKRYLNKKLKVMPEYEEIQSNLHHMSLTTQFITIGYGYMFFTVCCSSKQLGYFHTSLELTLSNKKLKLSGDYLYGSVKDSGAEQLEEIGTNAYKLVSAGKLKSKCTFYREPGGKKVAFTAKKGTSFEFLLYEFVDGELYIGVETSKGNVGWIKDSQKAVFDTTWLDGHIFG